MSNRRKFHFSIYCITAAQNTGELTKHTRNNIWNINAVVYSCWASLISRRRPIDQKDTRARQKSDEYERRRDYSIAAASFFLKKGMPSALLLLSWETSLHYSCWCMTHATASARPSLRDFSQLPFWLCCRYLKYFFPKKTKKKKNMNFKSFYVFSVCCACLRRCSCCISRIFCNQPTTAAAYTCKVCVCMFTSIIVEWWLLPLWWLLDIFSPFLDGELLFLYPKVVRVKTTISPVRPKIQHFNNEKKMKNNLAFHQHRSNNMKTSRVAHHLEKNVVEIRYNRPLFSSSVCWWPSCSQQQQHGAAD